MDMRSPKMGQHQRALPPFLISLNVLQHLPAWWRWILIAGPELLIAEA